VCGRVQEKDKLGMKIKKTTNLGEIMEKFPKVADYLMERYSLHCMGCPMASMETLEEGLRGHGFSKKEIEGIVEELGRFDQKSG